MTPKISQNRPWQRDLDFEKCFRAAVAVDVVVHRRRRLRRRRRRCRRRRRRRRRGRRNFEV